MDETNRESLFKMFDDFVELMDSNHLNVKEDWVRFRKLIKADHIDYEQIDKELEQIERRGMEDNLRSLNRNAQDNLDSIQPSMVGFEPGNQGNTYIQTQSLNRAQSGPGQGFEEQLNRLYELSERDEDLLFGLMPKEGNLGSYYDALAARNQAAVILNNVKVRDGLLMEF